MTESALPSQPLTPSTRLSAVLNAIHEATRAPLVGEVVLLADGPIDEADVRRIAAVRSRRLGSGVEVLRVSAGTFHAAHYETERALLSDRALCVWVTEDWAGASARLAVEEVSGVIVVYPAGEARATGKRIALPEAAPHATGAFRVSALEEHVLPRDSDDREVGLLTVRDTAPDGRSRAREVVGEPYRARLQRLREEIDADFARSRRGRRRSSA